MTHSQGPWTAEGPDDFGDYNIHEPGIRAAVAAVISNLRDPAEVKANADLVAAAPQMLAAILKTRDNLAGLSQSDEDIYAAMVRRLDGAIAAAAPTPAPAGFTEADFNGWRFNKDAVHFNGGSAFFGHGHRCVDQPRLLVIDKFFKRTRTSQRSYMVDGMTPCVTLPEALAALSVPPRPSDAQRELLRTLSTEWSRPERRVELLSLAEMGLVEWGRDDEKRVTCRLTAAGVACRDAAQ